MLNQATSRRGFLQKTGVAAALSAGAMALPASQAMAAPVAPHMDATAVAQALQAFGEVPSDARATMGMFRALTLKALASVAKDARLREGMSEAANKELGLQYERARGSIGGVYGWEPGDDICPPWWPWPIPWPPRAPWPTPRPDPWFTELVEAFPADDKLGELERAALDVFQGLEIYNRAFMVPDRKQAFAIQEMVLSELEGAISTVMNAKVSGRGAELMMWEPGDDICPPWWGPIIWQGPLVGPSASPEPVPWIPNRTMLAGLAQYLDAFHVDSSNMLKTFRMSAVNQVQSGFGGLAGGIGSYGYDDVWWCGNDPLFWWNWFRNRNRPRKPRVPIDPRVFDTAQSIARDVMAVDMAVRLGDKAVSTNLQELLVQDLEQQIGMLP